MHYGSRILATVRLSLFSLFPPLTGDVSSADDFMQIRDASLSPEMFIALLRHMKYCAGRADEIICTISGALPPAGPFVLFRLKRWGFSGFRASADREGLRITVRR